MNERGRGTLLLRPSFQFPYLSNSRVLKIYLPPKTDPQVMLEQWIEGRQVIAIYLATVANYHLTRKNTSYGLDSEMGGMESPQVATTTTYTMFG